MEKERRVLGEGQVRCILGLESFVTCLCAGHSIPHYSIIARCHLDAPLGAILKRGAADSDSLFAVNKIGGHQFAVFPQNLGKIRIVDPPQQGSGVRKLINRVIIKL